ncbi:MAG: ABC transporter ATP-binding protein [Pigmentiphaga sp.]
MMTASAVSATPLLDIRHLHKAFGGVRAVQDIGFTVEAGEMVALIGPNGAGKSTCFNLINGQLAPDQGKVLLDGTPIQGCSPRHIWRQGVGRTFQIPATFGSMTVLENLQLALASAHGHRWRFWRPLFRQYREEAETLLAQVDMREQANQPCGTLAYGDVKRVELTIALASAPRLLLMDEPTAGMAPHERHALMDLTRRLVDERGLGVLFTEHSLDVVFAHANRIVVMARGHCLTQGTPEAVASHPDVRAVYLGSYQP